MRVGRAGVPATVSADGKPAGDGAVLSADSLRLAMARAEHPREPFEGGPECDETTFGGARKGKRGWSAAGKVIVFGIVERNGLVKAQPIPAHDRASIMKVIQTQTQSR